MAIHHGVVARSRETPVFFSKCKRGDRETLDFKASFLVPQERRNIEILAFDEIRVLTVKLAFGPAIEG